MKVKQKLIINNIQEAIKYCRKRILSIIDEFYEYGVLSETYNKLIDYEQFCIFTKFLFEKFYDESICQNLFLLLINFNQFDYNKINGCPLLTLFVELEKVYFTEHWKCNLEHKYPRQNSKV
ncbi:hypothetical protein A3Q56_08290, partial [Intoshia linei]